jgi:hypothetical protein
MTRTDFLPATLLGCAAAAVFLLAPPSTATPPASTTHWAMNATAIEACSCPMFCQCYFNTSPAEHAGHGGEAGHFCRFNMAYKINKGRYGAVDLGGVKFWIAGDLGDEFGDGELDWATVTFDKAATKEQREAIGTIAGHLFPVKWRSFTTAEGAIDVWEATKDMARATLDGGKTAEIRLKRFPGMSDDPIVIKNLRYWGAPRNDGFVLMPNEVEAYRAGDKAFEYRNSNGFMITVDIASTDVAAAK